MDPFTEWGLVDSIKIVVGRADVDGAFAVYELGPSTEFLGPKCRLRVWNSNGNIAFEWRPGAAIDMMFLSEDGRHLALNTDIAPQESTAPQDSNSIILVDIERSAVAWRNPVPVRNVASVSFDIATQHTLLQVEGINESLRFSRDGDFLDAEGAERARMWAMFHDKRGYALLDLARSRIGNRSPDIIEQTEAVEIEHLVLHAVRKEMSSYQKAAAFRLLGEFAEARGDLQTAIAQYRAALGLNPKIGLKRKIQELESKEGQ